MTVQKAMATCFYLGRLPFAPGSWGSLGALVLWFFLPVDFLIHSIVILILFIIGVYTSKIVAEELKDHDPSEIVIDEVSGMWISLFKLPQNFILFLIGFILFRIFDIIKPFVIDKVQYYPGGIGIMADDILAGIFSRIIILIGMVIFI